MLLMKAVGIAVSVGGIAAFGTMNALSCRREVRVLEELLSFTEYVKNAVCELRMPVNEMFLRYEGSELTGYCRAASEYGVGKIPDEVENKLLPPMKTRTRELFSEFIRSVGKSFSDEQAAICERYGAEFAAECKRAVSELPVRIRLCRTLSLAAAGMVAVMAI